MNPLRSVTALGLLVLILASAGCAAVVVGGAAAAGIGTYKYVKGELKTKEKVSLDQAYDASIQTMQDMGFDVVQKNKDGLKGKIIAKQSNGDNIEINLERLPDDITEIGVRVGSFGDEDRSRVILDEIKKKF
jgi:hypothetical protein